MNEQAILPTYIIHSKTQTLKKKKKEKKILVHWVWIHNVADTSLMTHTVPGRGGGQEQAQFMQAAPDIFLPKELSGYQEDAMHSLQEKG